MKYLIVNGDDFGESPGVTSGILEAHHNGILTSTSMIVTSPFSEDAARCARAEPDLSCGLHFCLTNDFEGFRFDPEETPSCRSELRRQYETFVRMIGIAPTHLDSHHNIHRDARLLPLFVELAQEANLPLREHSPVRYFSSFYGQWDGESHLEQISVEMLSAMLEREAKEAGLPLRWPLRLPDTRRALAVAEWARRHEARVFPQLNTRGESIGQRAEIG